MTAYDPAGTAPLMPNESRFWRRILWLLLLLPLLPTILILLIAMTADLKGCMAEPLAACMIGPLSLGQAFAVTAELALMMGTAFMALAPFWVALCCLAVHRRLGKQADRCLRSCRLPRLPAVSWPGSGHGRSSPSRLPAE